jgi:tRNA-dihydrouridine synthase
MTTKPDNIWQQLNKPIFALAPMEDVTDTVFRRVVVKLGQPDLFFTEFTNVEGLCSPGKKRVAHRLLHTPEETPLIAQIWGQKPEHFYQVAQELAQAGFAGIDINMGCPDRSVVRRGQCSGLINQPQQAAAIIAASKRGAGRLPVSVKTRCGLSTWVTEEWISFLLNQDLAAITLHGRIAKEMSHFPARWDQIGLAANLRNQIAPQTLILGNGDVHSYQDGLDKVQHYGLDGVMVGRGIFSNPWIFNPDIDPTAVPLDQRLAVLRYHVELFKTTWVDQAEQNGKRKNYNLLKKFYKIYLSGLPHTTDLKQQLMDTQTPEECLKLLDGI